ncbi:MAG: mandelate racemase/muconate lactonizing enzyme family protein [Rhodospirillales bacterium]|jgi:D-galactarolactone cycloisomerase|nr:mandelate racemase/muconate lactonizing enzyme family protein [Rhodospirillales bacterium]
MKITNLEVIRLHVPVLDRPRPDPWHNMLLVRVDTDAGISGWGEAWSLNLAEATAAAIAHNVAPLCVGQSAEDISGLSLAIRKQIGNTRNGPLTYAVSALDIALWDIAGKAAGLPLCQMFGGTATSLPAYASLFRYSDPDIAAEKSMEAVARGYRHLKLHECEIAPVAATREAVGDDISIRLDPAWAWTPLEAIDMARQLRKYNLVWLEEPVWPPEDYRSLAEVARASGIPLAAGENCISAMDFRHLWEANAVSFMQPSVIKIGGITESLKVAALADVCNVEFAPHSYYHGPGMLASLHLAAASPHEIVAEHGYDDLEGWPYGDALILNAGKLAVPQKPGLGLDPNPGFLKEYAVDL